MNSTTGLPVVRGWYSGRYSGRYYCLDISCTETKHTPRTNQVNAKSICSHEAQQPMPQSNSQQLRFQSSEPKDLQNELQASGPQARGPKPASNPPNVGPPSRLVSCWAQYSCATPASASGPARPRLCREPVTSRRADSLTIRARRMANRPHLRRIHYTTRADPSPPE